MPKLKAIDLYSGVGGWSTGLKMAGIDVVSSYELWEPANLTNKANSGHAPVAADIRKLRSNVLPSAVDIVVGSPPCTEFSFSNRGGNGDIEDGLRDVAAFLKIVDAVQPKAWVFENVPRVAAIVARELVPGGYLRRFAHLGVSSRVYNMEDFGLPQRRKRCLVGNFDFDLLSSYSESLPRRSLGQVVRALARQQITDPIYGIKLPKTQISDHNAEAWLDEEEVRINSANKILHPVYNLMSFPDSLGRSVRTITATCTRVSRESVVIEDPEAAGKYRRLTLRERAVAQGFPIDFEFFGGTHGVKTKMIGNAMPPLFSFYVGQALRGLKSVRLENPDRAIARISRSTNKGPYVRPDQASRSFRQDRRFRFSIPSLHLKSGVRFEFCNAVLTSNVTLWGISFYFGSSKSIQKMNLTTAAFRRIEALLPTATRIAVKREFSELEKFFDECDFKNMQDVWSHRGPGGTRPFMILDQLGSCSTSLIRLLTQVDPCCTAIVEFALLREGKSLAVGQQKLKKNSPVVVAGLLLASVLNRYTGYDRATKDGAVQSRTAKSLRL